MEIKLTANQVAEIVNSDDRVKQAVLSLYLQRNPASLTITDLLVDERQPVHGGGTGSGSTQGSYTPSAGGIGSSVGNGCGETGVRRIGSLTTQQMIEACSDKRLME